MLLYSITARVSFDLIPKFKQKIYMVKDEDSYFPLVLVGNKCDLNDSREVSIEDGRALANSTGCPFFESSAKTRTNVEASFIAVVKEIKKRRERDNPNASKVADSGSAKRRALCILF
eukprot:TRINITY_DN2606_c0_g1_i3.p1 TRINITY_DN2606_c0_g1~~TRINITY_DN2606_c0_g1_i3.p1  ORF type:complete len:117 (+),score=22.74 TRINITY_DN2606_c0_g1_i3:445-795(+)